MDKPDQPQDSQKKKVLSEQAREVLDWARQGFLNKEIAAKMGLSIDTVNYHWNAAKEALGTHERVQTVCKGLELDYKERYETAAAELLAARLELQELQEAHESLRKSAASNQKELVSAVAAMEKSVAGSDPERKMLALFEMASACSRSVSYDIESVQPVVHRAFTAAAKLFGIDVDKALSGDQTFYDMLHPDDLNEVMSLSLGSIFPPHKRYMLLYRLLTPYPKWVLDSQQAVYNEDGAFVGLYGVAMDVHDLVLAGLIKAEVSRRMIQADPIIVPNSGAKEELVT